MNDLPSARFIQCVKTSRPPERADRSGLGTLPTRAYRYCEALTTATAIGWFVFPPVGFRLFWTGDEIHWTFEGAPTWFPLGSAQLPGFSKRFDGAGPSEVEGYSPPFLSALKEPGVLQVWSGIFASTSPNWSLVIRPPVNLARVAGYEVYEGLMETDLWFGPLFTNIRLTRTNHIIQFDPQLPLFQVQPVRRDAYSDRVLNDLTVVDFDHMTEADWRSYHATVVGPAKSPCPLGSHAAATRKRRRLESRLMGCP